jgi:uncharacterized membrane protein
MIYLKSILAGIVAVLMVLVLVAASFAAWQYLTMKKTGSGGVGLILFNVDLVLVLIIGLAIFCAGFYWQFRKGSAKNSL